AVDLVVDVRKPVVLFGVGHRRDGLRVASVVGVDQLMALDAFSRAQIRHVHALLPAGSGDHTLAGERLQGRAKHGRPDVVDEYVDHLARSPASDLLQETLLRARIASLVGWVRVVTLLREVEVAELPSIECGHPGLRDLREMDVRTGERDRAMPEVARELQL